MSRFLWICLGGACGTGARYLFSLWALSALGPAFPYGTLMINALGSFLLSAIMEVGLYSTLWPDTLRLTLTTGVMGGFTTYSTFNYDTLRFIQGGAWLLGCLNLVGTVAVCLLSGVLGMQAVRLVCPR